MAFRCITASSGAFGRLSRQPLIVSSTVRAPKYSTATKGGDEVHLEYTNEFVQRGRKNPVSWSDYKNHEYLNHNKWSYYDVEAEMTQYRLPQPNPKLPDKPRDTNPPAPPPPPPEKK